MTKPKPELPLNVEFQPQNLVHALLQIGHLVVAKDELFKVSSEDMNQIAYDIIYELCCEIMRTLKDENKRRVILDQYIDESNLKYLKREPKKKYMH